MISSSDLPFYILKQNEGLDNKRTFLPYLIKYLIAYTKEKIPAIKSEDNIIDVIVEANRLLEENNRESFFENYTDYLADTLFGELNPNFDNSVLINRKGVSLSDEAKRYYTFVTGYLNSKYDPYLRTLFALSELIKFYRISTTLKIANRIDKIMPNNKAK